jgi:hypothetical protein
MHQHGTSWAMGGRAKHCLLKALSALALTGQSMPWQTCLLCRVCSLKVRGLPAVHMQQAGSLPAVTK